MTKKRFTLTHINEQYLSANLYDNGTFIASIGIGAELIVELLNTLSDENEQLTHDATVLIRANQDYRRENEQLKTLLQNTSDQRDEFHRGARENANRVGKLEKENEELKLLSDAVREELGLANRDNTALEKENEKLKKQLSDCKEKKQQMKEFFMNSETVLEQKKLQKLIYQTVINLIDEKIKYYEHKPFSASINNPMSVNFDEDVDRLARLSELEQLKKELKSE